MTFNVKPLSDQHDGGQYDGDEQSRLAALRLAMELGADHIDVELKAVDDFNNLIHGDKPTKCKLIVSSHNYQNTPSIEEQGSVVMRLIRLQSQWERSIVPSGDQMMGHYMGVIQTVGHYFCYRGSGVQKGATGSPLAGRLFVVIGAGGAGKALAYGAKAKGARIVIANRTCDRVRELADIIGGEAISLADLSTYRWHDTCKHYINWYAAKYRRYSYF